MRVTEDKQTITFQMEGMEKFWSMKRSITLNRADIDSVDYDPKPPPRQVLALPFFKFPGTVIPSILFAGTFVKKGERDFWYLQMKHAGVLSIQTRGRAAGYDRLLISSDQPSAEQVLKWWRAIA